MYTPYFPTFRSRLAAMGRRRAQHLRQSSLPEMEQCLDPHLPAHLLSTEDQGPNSRERIYSLRLTFHCFIWQMLKPNTSCREVVRQVQALFRLKGGGLVKSGTSGYCQARLRLPVERLEKALAHLAQRADRQAKVRPLLQGRPLKAVDSTGLQLADTPQNQKRYPQPPRQRPGCGFPSMKLLALFSVCSGAILQVIMAPRQPHELRLFRQLWDELKRGDILLGDRAFGDYATLAGLPQSGVDVLSRVNATRKVDFGKGQRLAPNDGLFSWVKPGVCPPYLTAEQWAKVPASITVRIIRFQVASKGSRTCLVTLVTTLLDPKLYPLQQLAQAYARRWRLEICFLDLKTQMGMEQLRAQTPDVAQKEVWAYLIAYNLVRCVMAEASACYDADLERLSFKGTVDSLRQFNKMIQQARTQREQQQLWQHLLETIAADNVPLRPGRREPRAIKHRPKPFPRLTVPRRQFKERIRYTRWRRLQKQKHSKN